LDVTGSLPRGRESRRSTHHVMVAQCTRMQRADTGKLLSRSAFFAPSLTRNFPTCDLR
jgi:hypothetical protein